jgi:formylglycine-generating enzyme required for sulfatase activity
MNEPIKVFVSYSHQDDDLRKELGKHLSGLERRKLIKLWLDRDIDAGLEWASELDQNLEQAAIILLLVSADFIASEYCYGIEMTRALDRHEAGIAEVIPVIIRDCDWTGAPFGKLQAIPADNKAVTTWGNGDQYARDTAWKIVSKEIGKVAEKIRDRRISEFTAQQQVEARESFRSTAEDLYRDGGFSYTAQELLRDTWTKLGLEEAEAIEIQQSVQANLARYFKVLMADLGDRSALSAAQRQELKMLQSTLEISDGKAASLEQVALAERALKLPSTVAIKANESGFQYVVGGNRIQDFSFEVITVDREGNENSRVTRTAKFFAEKLDNRTSLEMVKIPGGNFQMGSLSGEGADDELPQHTVQVPEFWMGKYPVTQAQWRFVAALPQVKIKLEAKPSRFDGDNRPVERVSWHQSVEFCQRLSRKTGNEYRLPSEAEWEYACRAKTLTKFYFGDVLTPKIANFNENVGKTTNVGIYKPSVFGLYDMHGNVWEWCFDNYFNNYKNAPFDGSACIDSDNENNGIYVLRGGSWVGDPNDCRSAYRGRNLTDNYDSYVGFRVVYVPARTS